MPEMMQAAVLRQFGKPLVIEQMPVPEPGPGEMLVKVMACSICHTDLHLALGEWPERPTLPLILGHEITGVVERLGPGVTEFEPGDRVGVSWLHDACGSCEYCETGWENLCERQRNTGLSVNGGFAGYVIASAPFAARLPETADFVEIAPILGAGVTAWRGLQETASKTGDWVAICGIGGLGHLAVQYAQAMGLRVVALDIAGEKLELARELGVEAAVYAKSPRAVEQVREITGGGAHGVMVTAGTYSAFEQALELVRRRGTISLLGMPPGDFPVPTQRIVLNRITLRGTVAGTRQDLKRALLLAAEGRVQPRVERAPLASVNEGLERMKSGSIVGRVVLDFTENQQQAPGATASATA